MDKFWDVHDGGRAEHYTSAELFELLAAWPGGKIITDRMAQTIAGWWASPSEPYTARLSTMGKVDRYVTVANFATEDEIAELSSQDRGALQALGIYLAHHQQSAPSGARPCACDECFEIAIGRIGELCELCAEHGCSATEKGSCEVLNAC